jgi:ribosomal protein S10|uniref:Ribosomal protein S10 n=1 Tax=Phaeodactylum tricornutum TaxID=2850 RepID=A0A6G7IVL4_PHATR|nr:ribosomal protein S10 [Phaeodactylum tricornutum]
MRPYFIKISSKNKNSIFTFCSFLFNQSDLKISSKLLAIKILQFNNKRKFFTVLKSPHVNKTAQEQFESKVFSNQFLIHGSSKSNFLHFLKKLKKDLFPDLKLKISFPLQKIISNINLRVKFFDSRNYHLKNYKYFLSQSEACNTIKNYKKISFSGTIDFYECCENRNDLNKHVRYVETYLKVLDIYGELTFSSLKPL